MSEWLRVNKQLAKRAYIIISCRLYKYIGNSWNTDMLHLLPTRSDESGVYRVGNWTMGNGPIDVIGEHCGLNCFLCVSHYIISYEYE